MKIDIEAHISVQIGAQKCDYRKRSGSGAQKYSVLYANLLLHAVVVVDDDKVAAPVLVRTKILDKRLKLILHELSELSGILFFRLLFLDGLW